MKNKIFLALPAILTAAPILLLTFNCSIQQPEDIIPEKIDFERTLTSQGQYFYSMDYNQNYYFDEFIAQGGGKSDQEVKDFLSEKMFDGNKIPTINEPFGCASFNFSDYSNKDYHARNFDMFHDINCAAVLKTYPKNGYKSITNVDFNYFGEYGYDEITEEFNDPLLDTQYQWWKAAPYFSLDGINEKGLAISINQLPITEQSVNQNNPNKSCDLTTSTMLRYVLDYCNSVDSAIELLRNINPHDSLGIRFHYQISDASGKSVVVEYNDQINDELIILYPQDIKSDNNKFIVNENFALYKTNWSEVDWNSESPTKAKRFNKAYKTLLENNATMTVEQGFNLLFDVKQVTTNWSIVLGLDDLTMSIRYYYKEGVYNKTYYI